MSEISIIFESAVVFPCILTFSFHNSTRVGCVVYEVTIRSSRLQMFFKIGVPKKFRNIHSKTLLSESLLNKVACNFMKKRLQQRYFSVNNVKFLRTAFL